MVASTWQRAIAVVCVVSFLVTSCTSLHTVSVPSAENPSALSAIKVGDTVELTTQTKEHKRFKVTAVEADALVGKGIRVAYADMASLNVERIRKGPTTALVIAIVIVVASLVGAAEAIDEFGDAVDGPY